jgi:hypothetical protein
MTKSNYSTNLGLGVIPEFSQANFPAIFSDAIRVRNALRVLQETLDIRTGYTSPDLASMVAADSSYITQQNYSRIYVLTIEDFLPGEMARFANSAGVIKAERAKSNAVGAATKAFASTTIAAGVYGEFILEGMCYSLTGLTPGNTYYLADVTGGFPRSGRISNAPGTVVQPVGFAVTATSLYFRPRMMD